MVWLNILIFVLGLIFLVEGANFFVKSAATIARKLGISEFLIGLTVVAVGTSLPELVSSITASVKGASGLVMGNIIGSNIANIGLIVGVAASIKLIKTKEEMLKRDGYIMLAASFLFFLFVLNGFVSRIEALILLLFYLAYLLFLFEERPKEKKKYHFAEFIEYFFKFKYVMTVKSKILLGLNAKKKISQKERKELRELFKKGLVLDFLEMIVSGAVLILGAKYLIEAAIFFAEILKVPETLIGITLISAGTSLPELIITIIAAKKGYGNIAIGGIIGSNIANLLLVGGTAGLILPLKVLRLTIFQTIPVMILMSLLLLTFIRSEWKIRRIEGLTFILLYVFFILALFLTA